MVAGTAASLRTISFSLLLSLIVLPPVASASAQALQVTTNYFGNPFNSSYKDSFAVLGNASVNGGALQLTPDTRNNDSYLINKSGRVIYPQSFKLWEDIPHATINSAATNTSTASSNDRGRSNQTEKLVVSFNTTFDINIFRDPNATAGEGLAFVIFPNSDEPPPYNSYGGYLGLTNSTLDDLPSNRLVAIELDTFKQSYDPDDNHVGLNINSVRSNVTSSLTKYGIILSPANVTFYTVWVDYDGPSRYVNVFMAVRGSPKPPNPVLNSTLDLSEHASQYSYFGFAGSTGETFELNCVLSWNLTVEIFPVDGADNDWNAWDWVLRIGIPILTAILVLVMAILFYMYRRRVRDDKMLLGTLKSLPGMPREFRYKDLKKATNNFDEKQKLGQGGFGIVYRGVLPKEDFQVAVKKFSRDTMQIDFLAELTIINRLRHKHLVRLLGWCHQNGVLLLVYEYMPKGSLDHHLYSAPSEKPLSWDRRYTILEGVVSALHYLHNEYDQKVIHRDLKASNVMLDSDFNARLGDFGLARAIDNGCTSYAEIELDGVPGTMGYIAPECFYTGKATRESDVFGFGAVVLEVVCGQRPRCDVAGFRFLTDWVWKMYREGSILDAVDARLGGEYSAEDAERLLLLGLACSHSNPTERPKTQAIVQVISKSVPPPHVPPFRPSFVWPAGTTDISGDSSSLADGSSIASVTSFFYASTDVGCSPRYMHRAA